jgi:hypothetical protein
MHLLLALLGTQYLDVCELPTLGVTLRTHQGDGLCGASVSYLSPERVASYTQVRLPAGSIDVGGDPVIPAADFAVPGAYLEDGFLVFEPGVLEFGLVGVGGGAIELEPVTCTCTVR